MMAGHCTACGAAVTGKFCGRCGTAASGSPLGSRRPGAIWAVGGFALLIILVLVVMLLRQSPAPASAVAPADGAAGLSAGTPPDLSSMTPREQFDRLYNRVMTAAEQGDTATASRFGPMAFQAYAQLDTVDADARYHVAVLRLHAGGDPRTALLLADSIQATAPRHLFAYLIRGTAGQLSGDQAMIRKAYVDFLSAWDAEMASGKQEYGEHQVMLDQFRARARQSGPAARP
jgi:hypothetical protein